MNKALMILPAFFFLSLFDTDCVGENTGFSADRDTVGIPAGNSNQKKQFNPPGLSMEPFCMARDKGNGYLLAGDYLLPANPSFGPKTTALIRIDENGCILWSKTMNAGEVKVVQTMISTSDAGFLFSTFPFQAQNANYSNQLQVYKLDKDGKIQWAHAYGSGSSVSNYLSAVCETEDKGFVLEIGSFPGGGYPSYLSIIKTDPQGSIDWGHQLSMENDAVYNIGGVMEKSGFLYATGSISAATPPFRLPRSFLTKMDMRSGQTIWTRQNDPGQPALSFTDLHDYKNGLLINSFTGDLLNDLIYTDNDGNTIASSLINNPDGSLSGKGNILVTADYGLYFHQYSGPSAGPYKDMVMRLDSNQQISWQHDFYTKDSRFAALNQLAPAPANGMAAIGSGMAAGGLKTISFLKLDPTGEVCNSGNSGFSISANSHSLIPMTWKTDASITIDVTDLSQDLEPLAMEAHLFCPDYAGGCDPCTESVVVSAGNIFSKTHLPKDTTICTGQGLVLDAGPGYNSYRWQDGRQQQSLSVSNTGTYWVTVKGSDGCTSTETSDTIRVMTRSCSFGIHFPNAFTPNKDGHNDLFRPVVTGNPVVWHFSIYNRWGQLVFETSDPRKGWDGTRDGQDQQSGGYVWICTYQFPGEKENRREGDFLLIR
ncbi:MAG TPA: gliding motility-associated C-terminal domain-containing protein [Puia sp.]|nr:gliding motility-associated C-terminal domain-containing protein [Puia sp.]